MLKKNKHFATEDLCVKLAGLEASHIDQLRKEFGFIIKMISLVLGNYTKTAKYSTC